MARAGCAGPRSLRSHLPRPADVLELQADGRRARHRAGSRHAHRRLRPTARAGRPARLFDECPEVQARCEPARALRCAGHHAGDDPARFRAQSAHPSLLRHSGETMKLTDFKALTFDCYGTLIDWETGLLAALEPLAARAQRRRSREEILADYANYEHSQEHYTPTKKYSELLA